MLAAIIHTGITLSPKQVERGSALAKQRGLDNCRFMVMDALNMTFDEGTFDLVWGCESGEHMPDKQRCEGVLRGWLVAS